MSVPRIPTIIACLVLVACAEAEVLGGDQFGVWVKEPMVGSGSPDEVASKHCSRFGKKAVYEQTLTLSTDDVFNPTRSYACR